MTDYTFDITGKITVSLQGSDTEENYEMAVKEALHQLYREMLFDEDNITDCETEEYTEYEEKDHD